MCIEREVKGNEREIKGKWKESKREMKGKGNKNKRKVKGNERKWKEMKGKLSDPSPFKICYKSRGNFRKKNPITAVSTY